MARTVEITEEYANHIIDTHTGLNCSVIKVVDITEDCPAVETPQRVALLFFSRATRGRIVQICGPYEGNQYRGLHIHFFVEELALEMDLPDRDNTFRSTANRLGLLPENLAHLIREQAPTDPKPSSGKAFAQALRSCTSEERDLAIKELIQELTRDPAGRNILDELLSRID